MSRILVVIGTRPEAIKLAPLVHVLKACASFRVDVCISSQHRELLWPVLDFFRVRPDHDLEIMTANQTPAQVTCRVVEGVGRLLAAHSYDCVVVQGDTSTALGGGLAGFYHRVRVSHVEAGLRSGDLALPFPEEGHRRLLDVIADDLIVPTTQARDNLLAEGVAPEKISVTGNTGIDALFWARDELAENPRPLPIDLGPDDRLVLLTTHRRENFGEPLERTLAAVRRLVRRRPDVRVLFPVHPNPNVKKAVAAALQGEPQIALALPLGYPEFVQAMLRADVILTDSGGVQEEAVTLGKNILVLRDTTERPEGLSTGLARLVGCDVDTIVDGVIEILDAPRSSAARVNFCYGDGHSSEKIRDVLLRESDVLPSDLVRPLPLPRAA